MSLPQLPARLGADLAVLDWGIGGMGFVAQARARWPSCTIVYLSDAGVTPYGKMSRAQLTARVTHIACALGARGVGRLIIACNAASTVLPLVRAPIALEGVIEAGVAQALAFGASRLGVLGGRRTILSGAYARPLRAAGLEVIQRVSQPLSALIEAGQQDSAAFGAALDEIMAPLARRVDAITLACTHYVAAREAFAARAPGVRLLDPVDALCDTLQLDLHAPTGQGALRCFTTGDPEAMTRAAALAFGVTLDAPLRVDAQIA